MGASLQDDVTITRVGTERTPFNTLVEGDEATHVTTQKTRGYQTSPFRASLYREELKGRAAYDYILLDVKPDGTPLMLEIGDKMHVTRKVDGREIDLEIIAIGGDAATVQFSIIVTCALNKIL
jgi:hypothetical protein